MFVKVELDLNPQEIQCLWFEYTSTVSYDDVSFSKLKQIPKHLDT